jgi:hypothetical protein
MTKSCVLIAAMFAGLSAQTALGNGIHNARTEASFLRAQVAPETEPAWYVERSDNSSMRLSVLMQTRYMYNVREEGFITSNNIQTTGFSLPRTRIALDGTIVSSQFSYRVSLDLGDAELSRGRGSSSLLPAGMGSPRLLDAYAQYNFTGEREGYYFKFGQFQSIVMTEEAVDAANQLAVERSLSSEIFGPGYTQGIALGRVLKDYAWEFSVNDGGRTVLVRESDNTAFNDPDEKDLGLSARFDWKIKGDWDQFTDFSSWRGSNEGLKVGAGILYQFSGEFNPGTSITWTADVQYEDDGWSLFGAYTGTYVDYDFVDGGTFNRVATDFHSVMVQGGWFINDDTEWFARFEAIWIDPIFRESFGLRKGKFMQIATLGATRYLIPESHAAKLTADVSYAIDPLTVLAVGGATLGLPDPGATGFLGLSDYEVLFRLQLQLAF